MTSHLLEPTMAPLPLPSSAVVFCEVEGGAVLLSTVNEIYYGLNAVGARVWALLPPVNESVDSLCAALALEYPEVSATELQADVTALLDALAENGLVVSAPR